MLRKYKEFEELESILKYSFKNKSLLQEALSHPSLRQYNRNYRLNYERLEILGDALLGFIILEFLIQQFPLDHEGILAKKKAYLISKGTLANIAKQLEIGNFLIMTVGEEKSGGRSNINNLENALEAIIAAIYLDNDKNLDIVKNFILESWQIHFKEGFKVLLGNKEISELGNYAKNIRNIVSFKDFDPKSALQEWAQECNMQIPYYHTQASQGQQGSASFTSIASLGSYKSSSCRASNKKDAEKKAAQEILDLIAKCTIDSKKG